MFDTNLTQITGVLAFAVAAGACVLAAKRARGAAASTWKTIAVLQFVFLAEIVLGLRHDVHAAVDAMLIQAGWYWQRQTAQVVLLVLGLAIGAASLWAILRWGRAHRAVLPAAVASFAMLALFALEMISLHAIDAVLYLRLLGPLMLIAVLWAACATVVARTALKR